MSAADRLASTVAGLALTASALRPNSMRLSRVMIGAEMIRRGVMGHCYAYQLFGVRTRKNTKSAGVPYELGVAVRAAVTIAKPRGVVFSFWRDLRNLPRVMKNLLSVEQNSSGDWRWQVRGPRNRTLQWTAQIHNELENELIAWRTLPGSDVDSAGTVIFRDAPGDRGTEVAIHLQYNPPAGFVGAAVSSVFGRSGGMLVEDALFQLKQYLETGEVARTDGQPEGGSPQDCSLKEEAA